MRYKANIKNNDQIELSMFAWQVKTQKQFLGLRSSAADESAYFNLITSI